MRNQDIRQAAADAGVKLWQIAEKMGVSCGWFSVLLRKELNDEQKQRIFAVIEMIADAKGA